MPVQVRDELDDQRFRTGLLDISDAARFLGVPRTTFQRWARGYPGGGPLLHLLDAGPRRAQVPFIALAEGYVLEALRRAGVHPARIRPALDRLRRELGREYPLAAPELATDGIDVLWDFARTSAGQGLMAGHTGQLVLRQATADALTGVIRAGDGYPRALRLRHCEPSVVLVDPFRAFGQPVFAGSRARVADVAAMLAAGVPAPVVAEEHGVSADDVRTAARVLLSRAA